MHTILVLEDDIELNNTICCSLEKNGYRVMGARTCEEAKNYANSYTFHMAILDIMRSWKQGQRPAKKER